MNAHTTSETYSKCLVYVQITLCIQGSCITFKLRFVFRGAVYEAIIFSLGHDMPNAFSVLLRSMIQSLIIWGTNITKKLFLSKTVRNPFFWN